jgi:acetyl esterase/lipase
MYTARARGYAIAGRCLVVSTSYRLAPEARWPKPVEDVYAALGWIHASARPLGIDPDRVAIGGESAGGGLAAALALYARDQKGPQVQFQLLACPMLDNRTVSHPFAGEIAWTPQNNVYAWSAYLGMPAGSSAVPENAVPARAGDLSGLPPALVATSSLDLFVDEDIDYARRLIGAGVPTQLVVVPGAYHGFDFFLPHSRIAKKFLAEIHDALAAAFWG